MRVLGVDYGRKRIGLALSDATAIVARPWRSLPAAATPAGSAAALASLLADAREGGDDVVGELAAVVVGLPRRLSGEDTDQTQPARDFAGALHALTRLDVHLQDERLSSREAESRLARRERDWRRRKLRLDAAAAAVILQDFLDARATGAPEHGDAC
jgi:putative Holliday junction resolvase